MAADDSNPPLAQAYSKIHSRQTTCEHADMQSEYESEIELPLIDVKSLTSEDNEERAKCAVEIARASSEWGFFQVVNHGVSPKLFSQIRREQVQLFNTSFSRKSTCGLLDNSYRWGTPTATSPEDFSWSEAFHIPITKISDQSCYGEEFLSLREVMVEYAAEMQKLAKLLAGALVANLGEEWEDFDKMLSSCDDDDKSTCFFRLNRYPTCTVLSTQEEEVYGLVPHTDTDFLTILEQDQVGGLKLMKDSKWVTVKPRKDALIVNIGDLFKRLNPGGRSSGPSSLPPVKSRDVPH
ncbi:hypothetical protein OROHE_023305 [Orobanche hederae]